MGITKEAPLISIIIPCFNSGIFLLEALESCQNSSYKNFEILVIDDGSTEFSTLHVLNQVKEQQSVIVIHQPNGGPSSARNLGVANSKGEFLLFLDSDNRIRPDYLTKASVVLKQDPSVGVVFSIPHFFGDQEGVESRFEVREYSFDSLLAGNYIDMCSLVRKSTFLEVGGFDENGEIFFGEDWDLWIRIAKARWRFSFLKEILFEYRIRNESLMGQVNSEKRTRTLSYLGAKHGFMIHQRYRPYFRIMEKIQDKPFTYFLRIMYYKYILRKSLLN